MEFVQASKSRAYRSVVEQVCDAVITGELQVGDTLPAEREIAAQLGISRSSVREAMRVLKESGLVSRKAGGGGGTTIISDMVPVELLGKAIEFSHRRIVDLLEARGVLEIAVAELAAARADSDQMRALEQLLDQAQRCMTTGPDVEGLFLSIDPKFHSTVARASQNEFLFRANQSFLRELAVAYDIIPPESEHALVEISSMAAVVDAIKRRSPADARVAMAIHLSYFRPVVDLFFAETRNDDLPMDDS
jgi:GntR family transcriptional repressor for pyruvate dehydrogenase complex